MPLAGLGDSCVWWCLPGGQFPDGCAPEHSSPPAQRPTPAPQLPEPSLLFTAARATACGGASQRLCFPDPLSSAISTSSLLLSTFCQGCLLFYWCALRFVVANIFSSVAHLSRAFGEHTCFILIKSNLPFLLLSHFWHQVCVLFVYSQVLNIIYPVVSELLQFQSAAHVDSIFV